MIGIATLTNPSLKLRMQIWYGTLLFIVFAVLFFLAAQDIKLAVTKEHNKRMRHHANKIVVSLTTLDKLEAKAAAKKKTKEWLRQKIAKETAKLESRKALAVEEGYYAIVYIDEVNEIWRSPNTPEGTELTVVTDGRFRQRMRTRDGYREFLRQDPTQDIYAIVGINQQTLFAEQNKRFIMIGGALLSALLFMLLGGAFIVRYSLRSIDKIHETVSHIAKGKLEQRIETQTPEELTPLVTELNAAFEQLHTLFENQRRQSANASHELRTPIAALLAETETTLTMSEGLPPDTAIAEYRDSLETCRKLGVHMKQLIEQLTLLNRASEAHNNENTQAIDINAQLQTLHQLVSPIAQQKQQVLTFNVADKLPKLRGQEAMFLQAVSSIVFNAVEYTPEHGSILVSAQQQDSKIIIEVQDTGVGINKEDLPHIFERHFRGKSCAGTKNFNTSTSLANADHSGLGLAISKEVIEAMGGTVIAASEFSNGTTFTLTLPLPAA